VKSQLDLQAFPAATYNIIVDPARDNMVYIYNGNGLLVAVPKRVFTTIGN
jgi:hypothetical protein